MAATYVFSIDGVVKPVRPGWTHQMSANGRDSLSFGVASMDGSYRPAEAAPVIVTEAVAILTSSAAAATVITTGEDHGIVSGQTVEISGHSGSTPALSGAYTATRLSATTFSIPVTVTVGGTGGLVARRLFAGPILRPEEAGANGKGVVPIVTQVNAGDYSAKAEHRYLNLVLVEQSLADMLDAIAAACGFTVHPAQVTGPTVAEITAEYALVRDILDKISTLSGYTWAFDSYDRLRMYEPGTEDCPFDLLAGDGTAIGDVKVSPNRADYANRVILRYSDRARNAYAYLDTTVNWADDEEVSLGGRTYTFKSALGSASGEVLIGGSINDSLTHLVYAITGEGTPGVHYTVATTAHAEVSAHIPEYNLLQAFAVTAGAAGNSLGCTTTNASARWFTEGEVPCSTLLRGIDQALTNWTISEDAGEQATYGIWEAVVSSPETVDSTLAQTMADAYLALKIQVPKTVKYRTAKLGARPGQTQTITLPARDVDGTFLITEVSTARTSGRRVIWNITAIESLQVLATRRWQDLYRQWAGSASGTLSSSTVALSGTLGSGSVGGVLSAHLGGSRSTAAAPSPAAYTPVPNWVPFKATVSGSVTARVWLWARNSGVSVTGRVTSGTDGVTFGTVEVTGAVVTSTTPTEQALAVAVVAGRYYRLEILSSVAGEGVFGVGSLEGV